jgi:hypothetical protein
VVKSHTECKNCSHTSIEGDRVSLGVQTDMKEKIRPVRIPRSHQPLFHMDRYICCNICVSISLVFQRYLEQRWVLMEFENQSAEIFCFCSAIASRLIKMAATPTSDAVTTKASYRRKYQVWATFVRVIFYSLKQYGRCRKYACLGYFSKDKCMGTWQLVQNQLQNWIQSFVP